LFNFQGTLCARLLGGSFVIISKLFEFVKNFFQILLNFFEALFGSSRRSLGEQLCYYIKVALLCQELFLIRQNLFFSSLLTQPPFSRALG